ncbi:transporter [Sebaldella sp. S0638]|uniref:beta strand repeat-containing protein n=1 Tax=Sebaldella sp. S0638 TaxID=2957809 RepID=UPI00209FBB1C|nr:transporter [Sebaldella sp. S0638]MCP1226359.1 transporter [Sebaldella sp. S0638]
MRKRNKILLSFLALNAAIPVQSATLAGKTNNLYDNMVKNIESGKSNKSSYELIERILNQKNKELKDLYMQGDYIIKLEYLEWQIFFSAFYEEHGSGLNNTTENAKYSSDASKSNGKRFQEKQEYKIIDMGVDLNIKEPDSDPVKPGIIKPTVPQVDVSTIANPAIDPVSVTIPTLTTFELPSITKAEEPKNITVTSPTVNIAKVTAFNPIEVPTVTVPEIFNPVSLNFSASGFHQSNIVGVNTIMPPEWSPSHYVILNNSSAVADTNGTKITINNDNYEIENKFTWSGVNDTLLLNGTYGETGVVTTPTSPGGGGTGNIGNAYRYAVANIVASSSTLTGDWEFINNVTNPALGLGLGNSTGIGITRFAAISHGFGARDQNIEFTLNGTLKVTGSNSGHITIVFENQYYDLLPSKITNNATVTIEGGKRVFVVSLMNEGGRKCDRRYWGETASDQCRGEIITKVPLKESTYTNNGKIIMKNTESIGIDFGSYYNIGTPLYVYVKPGEMELLGDNSYAMRVPNIFSTYKDYFKETVINGETGLVNLEGEQNIGISLIRRISDSTEVTSFNGIANSATTDPIGNLRNLRFLLNGEKNIGILRDANYATQDILLGNSDIVINNNNVQELKFGNKSNNSILMRSDRAKIILDRNLVLDAQIESGKGNNVVMLANDSVNNNANALYKSTVENKATITFDEGLDRTTGLIAVNRGVANNKGTINIKSEESNGLAVFTNSVGENTGIMNIEGKNSLGIYNEGTLTMSGGTVTANGNSTIGIYGENTTATNLTGGSIISKNGGAALYSGDNSTINVSGSSLKAEAGGLIFYNYDDGTGIKGKYNISASSNATVEEGGILLYTAIDNISDLSTKVTNIKNSFSNAGNLNVTMDSGSIGMLVDTQGISANISQLSSLPSLTSGFFNFSGSDYYEYVMKDFDLNLDNDTDSNMDNGIYSKLKFINSNITVLNGVKVSGTKDKQIGAAQRNSSGAVSAAAQYVINNGIIELSGKETTGIAGDFITMTNSSSGSIKLNGEGATGIYTANGSVSTNEGLIELGGDKNIGIFGQNYFDGTTSSSTLGYGDDSVNIVNNKDIKTKSGGVAGSVFGIYADNKNTSLISEVTLGASSAINLEGTENVIGLYLNNTKLDSNGTINVSSQSGGSSVGLYGSGLNSTSSLTGTIKASGGNGAGIYLKDSSVSSSYDITVDNVAAGIGIYTEGASTTVNSGTISIGSNVTGAYVSGNSAVLTNTGTINALSGAEKVTGLYIGTNATGNNTGIIDFTATEKNNLVGIYNNGTFNMSGGSIIVSSKNGAGLYSASGTTANLSGGTITAGSGTTGIYADNSTVNLSGSHKTIVKDGGIFALNNNGAGNLNMTGNASAEIEGGGLGFYVTGDYTTYLANFVTGSGVLEINLKDNNSKLMIVDSPSSAISLSTVKNDFTAGSNLTSNIKISSSSNNNYTVLSVLKGKLIVDTAANLDDNTDIYNRTEFVNSSVEISSSVSGTQDMQMGAGQANYGTGSSTADRSRIIIGNTGTVTLSGNSSTGLFTNFGEINNNGTVSVTGKSSAGLYGTNGSQVINNGIINVGSETTGIYATNYLNGTAESYGDGTINVQNNGTIKSSGTEHGGYGIYVNNTKTTSDSKIALSSTSDIDVSGGEKGVGIYGTNTSVEIDGNIRVGKNGVGVYLSNSTGNINGGTIYLNGDNSVGYYLTNGTTLTNSGGSVSVDGKNVILMITDSGSNIVFSSPFTINATPDSTYTMGNLLGGTFYNNTAAALASNGSLINGNSTLVLFGTDSNVTSTGTNAVGMSVSGQYTGSLPAAISGISVSEEGTNLGIINLGDSSAGMYLTGGARGRNKNTINVGSQSLGMYAEGTGAYVINDGGSINVQDSSVGMLLSDGNEVLNNGNISVSGTNSAGIYVENTKAVASKITNNSSININTEGSTGIYTTGLADITNTGSITAGNSSSIQKPSLGVYQDNAGSTFVNSGSVNAGNNSIGVYNTAGRIQNSGIISAGDGGIGIYSDGGNLQLNSGSSVTAGSSGAIGVYAVNLTGTVQNDSEITAGDNSYRLVFSGSTTPVFINNAKGKIGSGSMYVFSSTGINAKNNYDIEITGAGSVGYYLKDGGTFTNTAVITGNTGKSNIGAYGNGSELINNGSILMGDSELYDYTGSDGTVSKAGYSAGMYGKNSNVSNNSTIEVGKDGIGIYVSGKLRSYNRYRRKCKGNICR